MSEFQNCRNLDILILPAGLAFPSVVLNNKSSLKSFPVTNNCDKTVHVKLSSSLGDQVTFQLDNENLTASNESEFAALPESFNQIFNCVNLISEITLFPRETRNIWVSFRPRAGERFKGDVKEHENAVMTVHTSFDVTGAIYFEACIVGEDETNARCYTVDLFSRACRSFFESDLGELDMSSCVPGESCSREFTIRNRSEIPLAFNLIAKSNHPNLQLECTQYETGAPVGSQTVPSFGHLRVRVTYKAREAGEYRPLITVENLHDDRNIEHVVFHLVASQNIQQDALVLSCGTELDFGDLYSGIATYRLVSLRNVTQERLDVFFGADLPAGMVTFDLVNEFDTQEIDDAPLEVTKETEMSDEEKSSRQPMASNISATGPASGDVPTQQSGSTGAQNESSAQSVSSDDRDKKDLSSSLLSMAEKQENTIRRTASGVSVVLRREREAQSDLSHGAPTPDNRIFAKNRIEEVQLLPGQERSIRVWYLPDSSPAPSVSASAVSASSSNQSSDRQGGATSTEGMQAPQPLTHLRSRKFKLFLRYRSAEMLRGKGPTTTQSVVVRSRVCTSVIEVSPRETINFGDVSIGAVKSAVARITNKSELPARVRVHFMSKVVTCTASDSVLIIPPLQSLDIKFGISPRRVNPDYRKQITITNLLNKSDEHIVEVVSNNIDTNMLTFHALFYDVITATYHNFAKRVDFYHVVVNNPTLRAFVIKNTSQKDLVLKLETSLPGEVLLYTEGLGNVSVPILGSDPSIDKREKLLAEIEHRGFNRFSKPITPPTAGGSIAGNTPTSVGPGGVGGSGGSDRIAIGGGSSTSPPPDSVKSLFSPTDGRDSSKFSYDSGMSSPWALRNALHQYLQGLEKWYHRHDTDDSVPLPIFSDLQSEEKYVKKKIEMRRSLEKAVEERLLQPCDELRLTPGAESTIYVVFHAKPANPMWATSTRFKKIDAAILIRLIEFDRNRAHEKHPSPDLPVSAIPPRTLAVHAKVCRSAMDLAQKNINFGRILNTELREKTLSILNTSESYLLYKISKTGSIASNDLHIESGRYGYIRPFGSKEVRFAYQPSLPGKVLEKLRIENVQDSTNEQVITIKADVHRPQHFSIKAPEINFGTCMVCERSRVQRITITNTSKLTRSFEVKAEPIHLKGCTLQFTMDLEEAEPSIEVEKMEQQIEKLEHKFRIAQRKGKVEKVAKLTKKLDGLRKVLLGEKEDVNASYDDYGSSSEDDVSRLEAMRRGRFKAVEHGIKFNLAKNATQSVTIHVRPRPLQGQSIDPSLPIETVTGQVQVYESKNMDSLKIVSYTAVVCYSSETFRAMVVGSAPKSSVRSTEALDLVTGPKKLPHTSAFTSATAAKKAVELPGVTGGASPLAPWQPAQTAAQLLQVTPAEISLGDVALGQTASGKFAITNVCPLSTRTGFVVLAQPAAAKVTVEAPDSSAPGSVVQPFQASWRFYEQNGTLAPSETRTIEFTCQPKFAGPQRHTVLVQSLTKREEKHPVVISLTVHRPPPIRFPDLNPSDLFLDFGECHVGVDKSFTKIVPFLVENVQLQDAVVLTATSNLSKQVYVLESKNLTSPADSVYIGPKQSRTLYICIRPHLGEKEFNSGETRTLVGGIRVRAHDPSADPHSSSSVLFEKTIRFKALVGRSVLRATPGIIDLGTTRAQDSPTSFTGKFTLSNGSSLLPLKFRIDPPRLAKLSVLEGVLDGHEKNLANSSVDVGFAFEVDRPGLHTETIRVVNESCSGQATLITIKLFVDDNSLETPGGPPTLSFSPIYVTLPTETLAPSSTPSQSSPRVEITPDMQVPTKPKLSPTHAKDKSSLVATCKVRNTTSEPMRLIGTSDLNLRVSLLSPQEEDQLAAKLSSTDDLGLQNTPSNSNGRDSSLGGYPESSVTQESSETGETQGEVEEEDDYYLLDEDPLSEFTGFDEPLMGGTNSNPNTPIPGVTQSLADSSMVLRDDSHFSSRPFEIRPGDEVTVYVTLLGLPDLSTKKQEQLKSRKMAQIKGTMMLQGPTSVLKVFTVTAALCLSEGRLVVSTLNLGRVGHVNAWRPMPFIFSVQNMSEAPLRVRPDALPREISLPLDTTTTTTTTADGSSAEPSQQKLDILEIDPMSTRPVHAVLRTELFRAPEDESGGRSGAIIPPGKFKRDIKLVNVNNPSNVLSLCVEATMTECVWRFSRVENGQLTLPPITHPTLSGALPTDQWFIAQNISNETLEIRVDTNIDPTVSEFLSMEALTRRSNVPIINYTLKPTAACEIRVRCAIQAKSERSPALHAAISRCNNGAEPLYLGNVVIRARDQPSEVVNIYGSILQGSTFTLSTQRLLFMADRNATQRPRETFVIKNLYTHSPLDFRVSGGSDVITWFPNEGTVPPDSTATISVYIGDMSNVPLAQEASTILLRVEDAQTTGVEQSLRVEIHRPPEDSVTTSPKPQLPAVTSTDNLSPLPSLSSNDSSVVTPSFPPSQIVSVDNAPGTSERSTALISLKGCTPIPGLPNRFEINLGQQIHMVTPRSWDLSVQNMSFVPVEYRIYSLDRHNSGWLKISRGSGAIQNLHESHVITLSFSADRVASLSAFLVLENVSNPNDIKFVRVSMEVVARENRIASSLPVPQKYFEVLIDGKPVDKIGVLDMDTVYIGERVQRHLEITNFSETSLDFQFTSSLGPDPPSCELHLSTTFSPNKSLRKLTVPPKSSSRLFVLFRPLHHTAQSPMALPPPTRSSVSPVHENPPSWDEAPTSPGPSVANNNNEAFKEFRKMDIYVSCRLVKDVRVCVEVRAVCLAPQMELSTSESILFVVKEPFDMPSLPIDLPTPTGFTPPVLALSMGTQQSQAPEISLLTSTPQLQPSMLSFLADPSHHVVVLKNLWARPLRFAVRTDSQMFTIEVEDKVSQPAGPPDEPVQPRPGAPQCGSGRLSGYVVPPESTCRLTVRPNLSSIAGDLSQLLAADQLEHFTIYNCDDLCEKMTVSVRFTVSHLKKEQRMFHDSSLPSSVFFFIEQRIHKFLREFYMLWASVIDDALASAGADTRASLPVITNELSLGEKADIGRVESVPDLSPSSAQPSGTSENQSVHDLVLARIMEFSQTPEEAALYFDVHYITDELVFLGTKGRVGAAFFDLAILLYGVLFDSPVFVMFVQKGKPIPECLHKWCGQLLYFLDYFPDKKESTLGLRRIQDKILPLLPPGYPSSS